MNTQEAYIQNIFKALFLTATVHAEYDIADEMWYVLIARPSRTLGGITYPAVAYHYTMMITSDDADYCFTETDELLEPVRFPIVSDNIFAIWENDDDR